MNDISPQPKRRRYLLMVTTALAVLIGIGLCWQYWAAEPRIASGQAITATGKFRFPDGATVLTLRQSEGEQTVNVEVSSREGTPQFGASHWQIDGTQPWIFTFGTDNKLWGYSSDLGPHSWHATPEASTFTNIGINGGWSGIPESFLESLPEQSRDIYAQWLAKQATRPQRQDG